MRARLRRLRRTALACLSGLLLACSDGGTSPGPDPEVDGLEVAAGPPAAALAGVPLADSVAVRVTGADGTPLEGVEVTWVATADGAARPARSTTDDAGRAWTSWTLRTAPGADTLRARVGGLEATLVGQAARAEDGTTYLGRRSYVEYRAGSLPLILAAPHGGTLQPPEIPDRVGGTQVRDTDTDLVAFALADALEVLTGRRPHLVVSHLHRRKLDPNREIVEAAEGHPLAGQAWHEFQGFIEHAKDRMVEGDGVGLFVDLHGHGHELQRLELGYLLRDADLALDDPTLASAALVARSSVRALAEGETELFPGLIRGPRSLGGLFQAEGYPSVPSPAVPAPGDAPYFTGGYDTARHGSRDGGTVSAVQIEMNFQGVRDSEGNREAFAAAAARALMAFLETWYGSLDGEARGAAAGGAAPWSRPIPDPKSVRRHRGAPGAGFGKAGAKH